MTDTAFSGNEKLTGFKMLVVLKGSQRHSIGIVSQLACQNLDKIGLFLCLPTDRQHSLHSC